MLFNTRANKQIGNQFMLTYALPLAHRKAKLTGKQSAAIELPQQVHSADTRLHYHYIGISELR